MFFFLAQTGKMEQIELMKQINLSDEIINITHPCQDCFQKYWVDCYQPACTCLQYLENCYLAVSINCYNEQKANLDTTCLYYACNFCPTNHSFKNSPITMILLVCLIGIMLI